MRDDCPSYTGSQLVLYSWFLLVQRTTNSSTVTLAGVEGATAVLNGSDGVAMDHLVVLFGLLACR